MTPWFLTFPKSKWCGWSLLPPGFLFPVKEQVACMKTFEEDPYGGPLFF